MMMMIIMMVLKEIIMITLVLIMSATLLLCKRNYGITMIVPQLFGHLAVRLKGLYNCGNS